MQRYLTAYNIRYLTSYIVYIINTFQYYTTTYNNM